MSRTIAVCSGSGGVGRTTLSVALALGAARAGKRAILLDACGPSRACDLLLGLENALALDLTDVALGEADMEHALLSAPQQPGLRLCCASLTERPRLREMTGAVLALRALCDALVIDLPAGELALDAGLMGEGDARLVLARPDDASLRAAEAMLRQAQGERAECYAVLTRCSREQVKRGRQYAPETAEAALDAAALAVIPEDGAMAAEVGKGKRHIWSPGGSASAAIEKLTRALLP